MRRPVILASLLLALFGLPPDAPRASPDVANRVLQRLQEGRRDAGSTELRRREDLDTVALERARRIGKLPHDRRLALSESIEAGLARAGVEGFREASLHLDMVRGYPDPAHGFLKTWTRYDRAWERAMDPRFDSVGIASHRATDDWVILVAVFLDEVPEPAKPRELEARTLDEVNRVRAEHDLPPLDEDAALSRVARAHSEEMARHRYFSHTGLDGGRVHDRIAARGIAYRTVAENIGKNRGYDAPVSVAVRSWMDSERHRGNMLHQGFSRTGVGVALDEEGAVYFTQVFLMPPDAATPNREQPADP